MIGHCRGFGENAAIGLKKSARIDMRKLYPILAVAAA